MSITLVCKKATLLYKIGDIIVIDNDIDLYLKLLKDKTSMVSKYWEEVVSTNTSGIKQEKPKRKYLNRKESIAT